MPICPLGGLPVTECPHCAGHSDPAVTMRAVRVEERLGGAEVRYPGARCAACGRPLLVRQRTVGLDHQAGAYAHRACAAQL